MQKATIGQSTEKKCLSRAQPQLGQQHKSIHTKGSRTITKEELEKNLRVRGQEGLG